MVFQYSPIKSAIGCLTRVGRVATTFETYRSANYRSLICNVGLVVLILMAVWPSTANALSVREYTKGRFTFTGYIGLKHEDRKNKSEESESKSESLRTQIQTNLKGFAWDPRFMVFNASLTSTQQTTETTAGKSEPTTLSFSLFTTWLPKRRDPFVLFLNHSVTKISTYSTPTYHLTTDNLGFRWGRTNRTFGIVRFAYDLRKATSSGQVVKKDQVDHQLKIDGKRRFKPGRQGGSDIGYGYRYDNREDKGSNRKSNEHRLFVNNRAALSSKMSFTADASSTYRQDDSNGGSRALKYMSAKSRINHSKSEQLSLNYSLSMNVTDSDESASRSLSGGGGVNYNISERWHAVGALSLAANSTDGVSSSDRVGSTLSGGLDYRQPLGIYNLSSNYSISISKALSGPTDGDSVSHTFGVGVSQSASSLWMDDIGYTIGFSTGPTRSSISQSVIYRARSNFTLRDSVGFTAEYRVFSEDNSSSWVDVERETSNRRAKLDWTHKLRVSSALSATVSYVESDNETNDESRDSQTTSARANFRTALFGLRNLQLVSQARYLDVQGDLGSSGKKMVAELGIGYKIGRWIASFNYDYSRGDFENQTYEYHLVTINLKRLFGFRF